MDAAAWLQIGTTWLLDAGFAWLVGSSCARHWMPKRGARPAEIASSLRHCDLAAVGLVATGTGVGLLATTAAMAGVGLREAAPMLWTMVCNTDYGRAACITLLAIAAIFLVRIADARGRASSTAVAGMLLAFALTRASMGHAGANGCWTIPLAADVLHFSAIGLWIGTVMVSAWFVLVDGRATTFCVHATDRYLKQMSQAALLAVVAITATGAYSSWNRVGTFDHLFNTDYGTTLLIKVGLVLVAIFLGAYNKLFGLPAAARSASGLRLVRTIL